MKYLFIVPAEKLDPALPLVQCWGRSLEQGEHREEAKENFLPELSVQKQWPDV